KSESRNRQSTPPSPPLPGRGIKGEVSSPPFPNSQSPAPNSNLLSSIRCLPYQPLSELAASLSAADLHVVVMGEPFVGIVHPCKIYNILNVGAPVLYIGPSPSHITEMMGKGGDYAAVGRGEVESNDVSRQHAGAP